VGTENPSAYAMVDWKVFNRDNAIITCNYSWCISGVNKPVHPIQNPRY
jgi:hypothetical protein